MIMTTIHQTLPVLRFPEFCREWLMKPLSAYLDFKNGLNASKESYGHGYKFINVLDIINNNYLIHDLIIGSVDVSEKDFKKNIIEYGDILFQRSSETREEVGQANVYLDKDKPATFGGFVIRGKGISKYDPAFMNFLLKTSAVRKEITSRSGGSTRYNVGQDSLSKVKIYTPDTQEQQKIASFLSSVDTKIEQLGKRKSLLEQYKQGMMQKLFNQEIRFKDDKGNVYPDWEGRRLGGIAKKITTKNRNNALSRVLTNSATKGILDQGDYFDKDIANHNNLSGYYVVKKNDYVYNPRISQSAPVGPINKNELGDGVMSPLYTVFRFDSNNDVFYKHLFASSLWHHYMYTVANYGARHDRMNITTNDFLKMPLPVPYGEEQQKIANFLSAIDQKIELVGTELELAQAFKKGLLQQMFI